MRATLASVLSRRESVSRRRRWPTFGAHGDHASGPGQPREVRIGVERSAERRGGSGGEGRVRSAGTVGLRRCDRCIASALREAEATACARNARSRRSAAGRALADVGACTRERAGRPRTSLWRASLPRAIVQRSRSSALAHSASTSMLSRIAMPGLGQRDIGADLRVRIAALVGDAERLAIAACRAACIAESQACIAEHEQRERAQVRCALGASERGFRCAARFVELTDGEECIAAVELRGAQLGRRTELREHATRGGEPRQRFTRAPALREHGAEVELGDRRGVELADLVEPARGFAIAIAREAELSSLLRDHAAERECAAHGRGIAVRERTDLERGECAVRVVELAEIERREAGSLRAQAGQRRIARGHGARIRIARARDEQSPVRARDLGVGASAWSAASVDSAVARSPPRCAARASASCASIASAPAASAAFAKAIASLYAAVEVAARAASSWRAPGLPRSRASRVASPRSARPQANRSSTTSHAIVARALSMGSAFEEGSEPCARADRVDTGVGGRSPSARRRRAPSTSAPALASMASAVARSICTSSPWRRARPARSSSTMSASPGGVLPSRRARREHAIDARASAPCSDRRDEAALRARTTPRAACLAARPRRPMTARTNRP